jgi:uncharacterized protein with von Willebrand factor type A (vWA) domain
MHIITLITYSNVFSYRKKRVTQTFKIINLLTQLTMTSKFIIYIEDVCLENTTHEEDKAMYEEHYKAEGYKHDEEAGHLYITKDIDCVLQEGDKIYMPCLTVCLIVYKQFDFPSATMEYFMTYA